MASNSSGSEAGEVEEPRALCSPAEDEEEEAEDIPPYAELLHDLGRPGDGADEEAASSDGDEIVSVAEAEGAEEEVTLFDGRWMYRGQHMATISGKRFQWVDNTPETPDLMLKPTQDGFVLDNFGQRCEAKLNKKGELVWNDNQVWTRMRANVITAGSRGNAKAAAPAPKPTPKLSAKARGHAAFREGRYAEAVRSLAEARCENPSDSIVEQLLQIAKLSAWEADGIPVMHMSNFQAAVDLVADYKKRGAEVKAAGSLAFREKRFRDAIPLLSEASVLDPNDTITQGLLEYSRMQEWEVQGIPVMRLGDYTSAMTLVEECEQVEDMTMPELKEWYVNMGFPDEKSLTKTELVKFRTLVKVWSAWPLQELYLEFERRGLSLRKVSIGDEEQQARELAVQILFAERMDDWEAKGLEAKRVGDPFMMTQLVNSNEEVDRKSMDELLEWYELLGCPREMRLTKEELKGLHKKINFWQCLPLAELRRECRDRGIKAEPAPVGGGTAEQREEQEAQFAIHLVDLLLEKDRMDTWEKEGCYEARRLGDFGVVLQTVRTHYEIDQMSMEELTEWYSSLNFPADKHLSKDDIAGLNKKVFIWQQFSLPELQKECKIKKVPARPVEEAMGGDDEGDKRLKLVNLLIFENRKDYWEAKGYPARRIDDFGLVMDVVRVFESIDAMTLEELKAWYRGLDFPEEAVMEKKEIADLRKKTVEWSYLPLGDLQKECANRKISITVMQTESEQYRNSLIDKLLTEDRKAKWNARGFAASRINVLQDVIEIVLAYESYGNMTLEELKKVYSELGLPEASHRRDLLRNIKQLLVWEKLPLRELQTECKERGLPYNQGLPIRSIQDRRDALVHRLRMDLQVNQVFAQEKTEKPPPRTDVGLPRELTALSTEEEEPPPQRREPPEDREGRASNSGSCESLPALASGEAWSGAATPPAHQRETMDWYEEEEDKEPGGGGGVRSLLGPEAEELPDSPAPSPPRPAAAPPPSAARALGPGSLPVRPQGPVRRAAGEERGLAPEAAGGAAGVPPMPSPSPLAAAPQPVGGEAGAAARGAQGSDAARLLSWAAAGGRPEAALLARLVDMLGEEEDLSVTDVPEEPAECTEFLEELGFQSPEETTQVRGALEAFRAEVLEVLPPAPRLAALAQAPLGEE